MSAIALTLGSRLLVRNCAQGRDDGGVCCWLHIKAVIACDKREAFAQGSTCDEAIHSFLRREMDCFAEPVIGRRVAPTRWLAMTLRDMLSPSRGAMRPEFC